MDILLHAFVNKMTPCPPFTVSMVCDCATDERNNAMLTEASHLYQDGVQNLMGTGIYNDKDDFAVILQPFFRDTEPAKDHVCTVKPRPESQTALLLRPHSHRHVSSLTPCFNSGRRPTH